MFPDDFTRLDYAALSWFMVCWLGYAIVADHSRWHGRSVTAAMSAYRQKWMTVMLGRENRVVDTTIMGNLLNGAAFFASTTIFAIGGLLAALGASDSAIQVLRDLPFVVQTSRSLLELKMLLLLTIVVFAFFKFAWAFLLYNYCSVLIGATPSDAEGNPEAARMALRAGNLNSLAARHFNQGVRAYFFALAALGWLLHPVVFLVTASWVVYVIHRRDFRSRSLGYLRDES